ncbi:hypothetical protein I6H52_05375 [Corynebacterium urealyticum]|uniref:hypothetical protein n=1 Tax=Corynebacterium urealyticum TaxID=43771 RepID=UPI0002B3FB14|nr:hypothetical protein [Corynebacterium urealyticum]AGE36837.1 hypothetical protein CU7111_1247 [Corynebacterium urealyticum DSM 7111]QQB08459.1 hypothetical protein I6H53_04960 [Corynebacterium urealyticum]QQE49978.1 hypothetical protein I6H52_05375 [Corynebacterium urealyticum]
MSNLGSYQWMVVIAKRVGGPEKLLALGFAASVGLWEGAKFGVRKIKRDLNNGPEISVTETPDGDLTVVEEEETFKSEGRLRGQHDSIDSEGSEENDEELS